MNKSNGSHSGQKNNLPWKIAGIFFFAGFLVCVALVCTGSLKKKNAEDTFESLAEQTNNINATVLPDSDNTAGQATDSGEVSIPDQTGIPIPDKTISFQELRENTNADIYAWIYIPETPMDYPVVQHATDNNYYLNHNLDGSSGYPGCIYTENYNRKDFTDPVTVLYGHNMKDGSMFAGLHRYKDTDYMKEHPYIYIYMEDKLYVYEIFAAYEYTSEHLLYDHDYTSAAQFSEYIENIRNVRDMGKVIRDDLEITDDDSILTLSTCISGKAENRFLVQGVLRYEG